LYGLFCCFIQKHLHGQNSRTKKTFCENSQALAQLSFREDDVGEKTNGGKGDQFITGCIEVPLLCRALLSLGGILLFYELKFIKQSLVTDAENLGGLTAVPAGLGQYALDGLALRLHGSAAADLKQ